MVYQMGWARRPVGLGSHVGLFHAADPLMHVKARANGSDHAAVAQRELAEVQPIGRSDPAIEPGAGGGHEAAPLVAATAQPPFHRSPRCNCSSQDKTARRAEYVEVRAGSCQWRRTTVFRRGRRAA